MVLDQIFWHLNKSATKPLKNDLKTEVVVIGGGMAGFSTAQSLAARGIKVTLLEKNFCGSGATGKSSGFITPDSEFSLHELVNKWGEKSAYELWEFATSGVEFIRKNIINYKLDCDYQIADCLVVALNENSYKKRTILEHNARIKLNYKSKLLDHKNILSEIGTDKYYGGVNYPDTFAINPFAYINSIKNFLMDMSINIYEDTPVLSIDGNTVKTPNATVTADAIVLCADYHTPGISPLKQEIYHAQTFLLLSSQLPDNVITKIFPKGNKMVWDTDLLYQYYRVIGDNRLLLGGSNIFYTYAKYAKHDSFSVYNKLTEYFKDKFPEISINFEYMWPGLIGVTKDIIPILGPDKDNKNLHYIAGAAGLPWAAALGNYMSQALIDNRSDLNSYFNPYRQYPVSNNLQNFIGKKLSFAISNFMSVSSF